MNALVPGSHVGRFEILGALGSGGMGEVYRARDTRLARDVAVKVLPADSSLDTDRRRRFQQEARAAGSLNHPNLVSVLDTGLHGDTPYIVFELLQGQTLRERLEPGPLPARKAIEYAVQIAHGLAAAHEAGIVHRDLKPENLFLTADGRLKILDFGLAKLRPTDGPSPTLTQAITASEITGMSTVLGTTGYMSPEQVAGEPADHRSDIFSFGSVFSEMLSGRRAFRRDSAIETMRAILKEDPAGFAEANGDVPPPLERIVRRCLEKRPEERFQSARDIAFALDAFTGWSGTGGAAGTPWGALPARHVRKGAVWLLALAATMATAYLTGHRAGEREGAQRVSFAPLSLRPQAIFRAAFAPDGRSVVYSAALRGNTPELFALGAEPDEPRPLASFSAHLLSVSPRGELAILTQPRFLWHRVFVGTLARMSLGGGDAPRPILENVRDADWAPDGESLAVVREVEGKNRLEYPVGRVLFETAGYLSDLRFSHRGDRIAFLEHPIEEDDRGFVAVVDLTGRKSALSDTFWGVEGLAWSPDDAEVLFGAGTGFSGIRVHAVSLSRRSRTALQSAGSLILHDVSRKGSWLCVQEDSLGGMRARGPDGVKEQSLTLLDTPPSAISRDGRALLFTDQSAAAGVNYSVGLRLTDGSPLVRLGEGGALDLSPDGQWALAAIATVPAQLIAYPTGPGQPRPLPRGPIESYRSGRFFPDSRRVLVCAVEAGRAQRCYVQGLDGDPPHPVTPEGTQDGRISPDGTLILAKTSRGEFRLFSLAGGGAVSLPFLHPTDEVIGWSRGGDSLLVYARPEVPARLERVWLDRGERLSVRELAPPDLAGVLAISNISLSADEASYAYGFLVRRSHLYLVTGAQ